MYLRVIKCEMEATVMNNKDLMRIYTELEKMNTRLNELENFKSGCEKENKPQKMGLFSFIKEKMVMFITFLIKL